MLKSWKTSLGGLITALALSWKQLEFIWDGIPETNPDYNVIAASIGLLLTLIFARDNDVTSEKADAK